MARVIIVLAVFTACVAVCFAVVPQNKMYFTVPLPAAPAPAAAAAPAATTAAPANATNSTTAATTGANLNFIPLGQFLGTLIQTLFGPIPSGSFGVYPLIQVIGYFLVSIFGFGFTPVTTTG